MRVLVVGAGMLGAAVSSALSVRGHEVTVLDAGRPAGGTSSTTFAWVNANNKRPMHYQQLNADAMREHVRLGGVPRGWLVPTGHLEFATNDAHRQRLTHRVETLRDSGYRAEFVTPARAAELEPDVQVGGDPLVAWFPDEGHCFPERYVAAMTAAPGITIETGRRVTAVEGDGTVRLADGSTRTADHVVACVGRDTAALLSEVRMTEPAPGNAAVGFLATTGPVSARLSRVVTSEGINLRPAHRGSVLVQTLDQDGFAVPGEPVPEHVRETMRRRAAERLGVSAVLENAVLGVRSLPSDGLPVAGYVGPRTYALAGHSGVTLAPLLGELAAREICGERQNRLEPYRPGRFTESSGALEPPRRPGEQ